MAFNIVGVALNAFRLAWRNIFKVVGYQLIALVISIIAIVLSGPIINGTAPTAIGPIASLVTNICFFVSTLAAIAVMSDDAKGYQSGFIDGIKRGLAAAPMTFVASVGLAIIVFIPSLIVLLATGHAGYTASGFSGLAIAGFVGIGLFVAWIATVFAPIVPVLVIEGAQFGAFRRAMELTKGKRLAIFLTLLFFALTLAISGGVVFFLAVAIAKIFATSLGLVGAIALMALGYVIAIMVIQASNNGLQAAIYAELTEDEG